SNELVRNLWDLCSILRGHEGTRNYKGRLTLLACLATFRWMVCCYWNVPGFVRKCSFVRGKHHRLTLVYSSQGFSSCLKVAGIRPGTSSFCISSDRYSFESLLYSFITQYLSLVLFFVLYGVGQLIYRTRIIRASDLDFVTGLKEIEAETY